MQQFSESKYFPKKLDKLTHRVAKLLSQKYALQDDEDINKDQIRYPQQADKKQIELKSDDIAYALDKSERMNNKLKLIRTMLGYEYESKQKMQHQTNGDHSSTKFVDEKGTNLKQFVISMRKRNEILEKYFKNRNNSSPEKTMLSFGPQGKNVQEYTDASLKYVHSFLPHHSTIQNSPSKIKKSIGNSPTPKLTKYQNLAENSISQFENNTHSQQQQCQPGLEPRARAQYNHSSSHHHYLPSKHSHQLPQAKHSLYQTIDTKRSISIANEIDAKSNVFLPGTMQNRNTLDQQKYFRREQMKSRATSFQVYTNRVTQSIYKGKNHTRQIINSFKINKKSDTNTNFKSKEKKLQREILPTICSYEPKSRPKRSSGKKSP